MQKILTSLSEENVAGKPFGRIPLRYSVFAAFLYAAMGVGAILISL